VLRWSGMGGIASLIFCETGGIASLLAGSLSNILEPILITVFRYYSNILEYPIVVIWTYRK
jgi:hypothetical protein